MKKNEEWYERFHNEDFTRYIQSGEASAVHVARDLALKKKTNDQWIDVVSMRTYTPDLPDCKLPGFHWIIVELFPRITHPNYGEDIHENRYLCWVAAHGDIAVHRAKNHQGPKYLILCKLFLQMMAEIKTSNGKVIKHPVYDYYVTDMCKIRQKRIDHIQRNEKSILAKIQKNGEPELSMF